jgi:hypothetical protein
MHPPLSEGRTGGCGCEKGSIKLDLGWGIYRRARICCRGVVNVVGGINGASRKQAAVLCCVGCWMYSGAC